MDTTIPTIVTMSEPPQENISLQQMVFDAAALGWSMAELLGRCFTMRLEPPTEPAWNEVQLIAFQENYTQRYNLRPLMYRIHFQADKLDLTSFLIYNERDPDYRKRFIDELQVNVKHLSELPAGSFADSEYSKIRSRINELLFSWDLRINDALQNRPPAVHRAYLVGRVLASLRWFFGLHDKMPDNDFISNVLTVYLPMLQPYLSAFATGAVAHSLTPWWKVISAGQLQPGPDGEASIQLQRQADIWFSLVTGERDALSYTSEVLSVRRYIWRVFRLFVPLFSTGGLVLMLILLLLLFILFSNINITLKVTLAVGIFPLLGITQSLVNLFGDTLKLIVSSDTETSKGSVMGIVRNSTLQQAVNDATFIPPM